jgi:SH3 domain
MGEYVYARYDFVPMYEDEISLRAGDCIEVIEKDEPYGDGWWQVRSLPSSL